MRQYTWEHGRELATITKDGATWTNTYNQDGMRIRRTNGTVTYGYVYNGSQLSQMTVGSNTLNFSYDANGIPMSVSYNGTTYYYATNLQGDVTAILNASGSPVVSYTYDAWGKPLTVTGSLATTLGTHNPLRYRGYVYDTETGFYYVSSRYYDPEIGRFINADTTDILTATPMGLTDKNLFAYCDNNPVMRTDHGGDFWHIVVGAAVGALIGGVVKAVSNAIEGKSLTDGLATAMLAGAASGALASTGVGIVGMVAGNAAISMAENAADQVIENKGFNNFDVGDMLIDGAIGGVSGALGGAGKGTKHRNPSHFRKKFKEALAKVDGVRALTPHCCRHTYVSQMQALGVDLATIQSIVGHADVDMTKHYLHVQDSIRQAAIEKFSEAFACEKTAHHHLDLIKSS